VTFQAVHAAEPPSLADFVPDATTTLACRSCHAALQPDERFCPTCGISCDPAGGDSASPWSQVLAQLQAATIGEFELSRELGRGGMAAVYLAREVALNRMVAIKVMSPGLFLGPGMVDRFRQEAVTVANLSHPNIITIHAVRQIEDLHFLVMKCIEGRSFEAVLHANGPLSPAVVRAVMFQVGSALAYAHRRGVIHRDVKPGNVLLDAEGNAIVTDFGIAKLAEQDGGHTQTGTMVGTPAYMSPEQCYGGQLTWSSDLYSLGIVAYELLTGTVPFSGTPFNVMQAHTVTPPPSLRERRSDCPPELDAAVLQMLAKLPADRYATMAEALTALGATPLTEGDPLRAQLEALALPDPSLGGRAPIRPVLSPAPLAGPRVGQLTLGGAPDIVVAGDRFELRTAVRSDAGATLSGRAVSWSSTDDTVAAVTANGLVTARAPGRVNITATCEGVLASLPITVLPSSTRRRDRRSPALIAVGLGGAILLASGVYLSLHHRTTPTSVDRAVVGGPGRPADSGLPASRPETRAVTPSQGTAEAPSRTNGDTQRRARPIASGTSAKAIDTSPPPTAAPAPPPVAPAPPPPAAIPSVAAASQPVVSPAEISRGATTAAQAYIEAIRARSTDQMRKVYPGLPAALAAEWQSQFNLVGHEGIDQLDVALVGDIKVIPAASNDRATTQFMLRLTLRQRRGDSQTSSINVLGTLHRDGTSWRFETVDQRAAR
jgi:serine/threonine-protein kinase